MALDDRITIIHAPNGYGKTTILRLLNGFFTGRFTDIESVPFDEFSILLEDSTAIRVFHLPRREKRKGDGLLVRLEREGILLDETHLRTLDPREAEFPLHAIDEFLPFLTRIGESTWRNIENGEELSFGEIFNRYEDMLPVRLTRQKTAPWLRELTQSIKIRFIESQRLSRDSRNSRGHRNSGVEPAVAFYSKQIAREMTRRLAEYAELSQSLDQTFPMRLVEHLSSGSATSMSPEELEERLGALDQKRARLREAGLLEREDVSFKVPPALQDLAQQVLPMYVSDVEKKLGVFANILEKIELFKAIVSQRFRYKTATIDKENGFTFESMGQTLSPMVLSSGEQHLLVLWSELIFMVDKGSLVLIDEPEMSLHISWQQDFLRELSAITRLSNFDALIATHSPQIINERFDLVSVLEGPEWHR